MYGAAVKWHVARRSTLQVRGMNSSDDDRPQSFRDLRAWQEALALAVDIDRLVASLPRGRAALADQLRRASGSVHANIAEGSGRSSRREYLRSLDFAKGSLLEVESNVAMIRAARLWSPSDVSAVELRIVRTGRLLDGLIASLRKGDR